VTNAIDICKQAYRKAKLNTSFLNGWTSFSVNDESPYDQALDLLNQVIREISREKAYSFQEDIKSLTYTSGISSYNLKTLGIEPERIYRVRKTLSGALGEIKQIGYDIFSALYDPAVLIAGEPSVFSKFGTTLFLNSLLDKDYGIKIYYYKTLPLVVSASDTFIIPEHHEDVLVWGVYAYLLNAMIHPNANSAYAIYREKLSEMKRDQDQDYGIALAMPAVF